MTSPALSDALARMLYAASDEQAMEWARRVVRLRFAAGEYPLVSMLDEEMVEALARIELKRRTATSNSGNAGNGSTITSLASEK